MRLKKEKSIKDIIIRDDEHIQIKITSIVYYPKEIAEQIVDENDDIVYETGWSGIFISVIGLANRMSPFVSILGALYTLATEADKEQSEHSKMHMKKPEASWLLPRRKFRRILEM